MSGNQVSSLGLRIKNMNFWNKQTKTKENQKNILILTWRDIVNNKSDFGGNEVYIDKIANGLANKGYNVTVFSSKGVDQSNEEILNGVRYIRKGSRCTVYFWAALYYIFGLGKNIDFIIDSENGVPFFTPLYTKKPKVLLVHHFHNGQWFKEFPLPIAAVGYYIERFVMPLVYKNTRFVTVSNSSKLDLEFLGITPDNVQIAYNGTNLTGEFDYAQKELYENPIILYLGRLREYKRIDLAISAVAEIKKSIPNIKLIIAGTGDDESRLKEIVSEMKLEDNVSFLGFVNEVKKQELLAKSWVYVNPSSKEGWGIVNIEANYYGTPVVGFNVFGVRDSVKDGYSGYLAENFQDFVNKLLKALKSENGELETMQKNAINWASKFNWEDTVKIFDKEIAKQTGSRTVKKKVNKEVDVLVSA